jgi:hypothetical protein
MIRPVRERHALWLNARLCLRLRLRLRLRHLHL